MRKEWVRTEAGRRENLSAAAVALALGGGVAAVAFYLVRTMLARAPITTAPDTDGGVAPDADEG